MSSSESSNENPNLEPTRQTYPSANRIAFLLPSLFPIGGLERLVVARGQRLSELGYRVDYVFVSEPNPMDSIISFEARTFDLQARKLRLSFNAIRRYLVLQTPDIVEAAIWPLTSVALIAHRLARSKARLILSDHNPLSLQYADRSPSFQLAMRAMMRATYPLAHARFAVSRDVANDVARLSGMAKNRIDVVHNPVPLDLTSTQGGAAAEQAWGGWQGKRILTVGRLKTQKNHALLLEAIEQLATTMRDARLMILGVGDLEEELKATIKNRGRDEKVIMAGHVDNPVPFYRSADLFVLSSDYEGFGNVLIEALGCGLPVVSTDCPGGPREILNDGEFGTLVPIRDPQALATAICEALSKKHDTDKLKLRAADFSLDATTGRYLDVLFGKSGTGGTSR